MLDLESKNPVIIDQGTDLDSAAKLIGTTTFFNAGLIPYNPDYILVHSNDYEAFKKLLVQIVTDTWGTDVSKGSNDANSASPQTHPCPRCR